MTTTTMLMTISTTDLILFPENGDGSSLWRQPSCFRGSFLERGLSHVLLQTVKQHECTVKVCLAIITNLTLRDSGNIDICQLSYVSVIIEKTNTNENCHAKQQSNGGIIVELSLKRRRQRDGCGRYSIAFNQLR